jgi:hypothetical protein
MILNVLRRDKNMNEQAKIMFDKPYITIHWNPDDKIILMEWKAFVMGDNFREALDTGLNLAVEHGTNRWLADLRKLGVLSNPDQKWSVDDWHPRALDGGINRMALVLPESAVATMGVNNIMRKVNDDTLIVNYFATVEEAYDWLASS